MTLIRGSDSQDAIKSFSGRLLTMSSDNAYLNPNNQEASWLGKSVRWFPRLVIGVLSGLFGGIAGVFWHSIQALSLSFTSDPEKLQEREMHWESAGADAFRVATGGIGAGLVHGFAPDAHKVGTERIKSSFSLEPLDFESRILIIPGLIYCAYDSLKAKESENGKSQTSKASQREEYVTKYSDFFYS